MTQKNTHAPLVLGLLLLVAVLVSLSVVRLNAPPQLDDLRRLGVVEFNTPRDFSWPDMVDEKGAPFSKEQLLNRWTLVFFGFSHCPDICPATMSVFAKMSQRLVNDRLSEDTRYLMVSVDPKRDTSERLGEWLHQFGRELKGVRGDAGATRVLARDFSVAVEPDAPVDGAYNIYHGTQVFLVGPDARQHAFVRVAVNAQLLEQAYRSVRKRFEIGS